MFAMATRWLRNKKIYYCNYIGGENKRRKMRDQGSGFMLQFLQLQRWLERFSKPSCPHPFHPMHRPLAADYHPFNSANSTICMFKL